MKPCHFRFIRALVLSIALVEGASAQTFTTLHGFSPLNGGINDDGANPLGGLFYSSNTLYGTAQYGGSGGTGTIFAVGTSGSGFSNVYSFTATSASYVNNDGADPNAGVILAGNTLYGTASTGGNNGVGVGYGTVFSVNANGSNFNVLHTCQPEHNFPPYGNAGGGGPLGGLVLSGNTVYGTMAFGGSSDQGAVFSVNTDNSGFTNQHNFGGSDGSGPHAAVILSGANLYGTTSGGFVSGGSVFCVSTDGSVFTNLHRFSGGDGADPESAMVLSGGMLYGTTKSGGTSGKGTVFGINTSGDGFTNLYSFTGGNDGAAPLAALVLSGATLYGTASAGGAWGNGAVFAINTNGHGFTNLYSFTALNNGMNSDGANPTSRLCFCPGTLFYGTTEYGGVSGNGTVNFQSFIPAQTQNRSFRDEGDPVVADQFSWFRLFWICFANPRQILLRPPGPMLPSRRSRSTDNTRSPIRFPARKCFTG